jgi:hypothetical protein
VISAGMVTHTSIPDFLNMKIRLFYKVYSETYNILKKREE